MPNGWNATMNVNSYQVLDASSIWIFASATGLIILALFLIGVYSSLPLYSKLRRIIELGIKSITYFLWGLLGIAAFGLIAYAIRYFSTPGDKIVSLLDIGKGIAIYLAICGLGYLIVRLKNRVKEHEDKIKVKKETVASS